MHSETYITRILLHFVLIRMRLGSSSSPKTRLAELIVSATLTFVSESGEWSNLACVAYHWMIDMLYRRHSVKQRQPHKARWTRVAHNHIEKLVEVDLLILKNKKYFFKAKLVHSYAFKALCQSGLRKSKGWSFKNDGRKRQNLLQIILKLFVFHNAGRVGNLWKNI